MVLLFHMAGSNLGEYATIAPAFARRGFDTLAIDQRSGGPAGSRRNETAARLPRDPGFMAAMPDLEGALAYARERRPQGRVLVLGSSYSAALVFLLAAGAGASVSAVLAFSPGSICRASRCGRRRRVACRSSSRRIRIEAEQAGAAAILAAVPRPAAPVQSVAGAHGASILREDRDPRRATAWSAVGLPGRVAPA